VEDKRTNYSREAFIEKVWSGSARAAAQSPASCGGWAARWTGPEEQFTMDPHFTKAVVKIFVDLYDQGLIYRDKRLVNRDPRAQDRDFRP